MKLLVWDLGSGNGTQCLFHINFIYTRQMFEHRGVNLIERYDTGFMFCDGTQTVEHWQQSLPAMRATYKVFPGVGGI